MNPVTPSTDPTGRCFLSYRRSRLKEVERLIPRLHEHGIPTWQDRQNLTSEPTVEAIAEALEDPLTAGAIMWLSADVAESTVILQEEAPRILRRARAKDGFTAKLCLADSLKYDDATKVLKMPASIEDPSKTWNLRPIDGNPASEEALRAVSVAALKRRLATIHARTPPEQPLRLSIHAHALAKPAFEPGCALLVDWTSHFKHRHVSPDSWNTRLLPALAAIAESIRTAAPRRKVLADGFLSLASAFALGRAFMEPSGLSLTWRQLPKGDLWSLTSDAVDCGFVPQLASQNTSAHDLAVLVSIRGNVEPAVSATNGTLPGFRAILRISPQGGEGTAAISGSGQASHVARLVADQIRQAKQRYPVIRKTHIFYSGPAGVAMMIGQQLNALGPVQTYEHHQTPEDAVGTYVPAALLCDQTPCF